MKNIQQNEIDNILSFVNKSRTVKLSFDEIHGYIASIVCAPRMIKPAEWLNFILKPDGNEPAYDSQKQAEEIIGIIFKLYNDIIKLMERNEFDPYIGTFDLEEFDNNDPALWCRGFSAGMVLWDYDFEEHRESEILNYLIPVIYYIDKDKMLENDLLKSPLVDKAEIRDMIENMVYYIGPSVILVYEYFNKKDKNKNIENNAPDKVGRNEPCPCGSGKKYKKCCGK